MSGFSEVHVYLSVKRVHLRYLKGLLRLKNGVPSMFVYGEFGRFPMSHIRILNYWCKLVQQLRLKYYRRMYEVLRQQAEVSEVMNWASLVRELLCSWVWARPGCTSQWVAEIFNVRGQTTSEGQN